jgi:hypothetical protein
MTGGCMRVRHPFNHVDRGFAFDRVRPAVLIRVVAGVTVVVSVAVLGVVDPFVVIVVIVLIIRRRAGSSRTIGRIGRVTDRRAFVVSAVSHGSGIDVFLPEGVERLEDGHLHLSEGRALREVGVGEVAALPVHDPVPADGVDQSLVVLLAGGGEGLDRSLGGRVGLVIVGVVDRVFVQHEGCDGFGWCFLALLRLGGLRGDDDFLQVEIKGLRRDFARGEELVQDGAVQHGGRLLYSGVVLRLSRWGRLGTGGDGDDVLLRRRHVAVSLATGRHNFIVLALG